MVFTVAHAVKSPISYHFYNSQTTVSCTHCNYIIFIPFKVIMALTWLKSIDAIACE